MKTILVVYTGSKLTKSEAQTLKRYAFNVSPKSKVKVGDLLRSDHYGSWLQVVEILPKAYKYVNTHTGDLSNQRMASTRQFEIRTLHITDPVPDDVIVAERINVIAA